MLTPSVQFQRRTCQYTGRGKVIGRIAGQMVSVIYVLRKSDQETLSKLTAGAKPADPVLYDPDID